MRDIKWKVYMCVNILKLKLLIKTTIWALYILKITYYDDGTAILGVHAVDKRRKEWLLTISIAFLLLDRQDINLNETYKP